MSKQKSNVSYWIFLILISYPILYYNYKFGNPNLGLIDFFDYYPMYLDWNFEPVESPFNTRIFSISLVYLFVKTGIYYPTKISFTNSDYDPELLQLVFFNANLVSYIGVLLTCYFIRKIVLLKITDTLFASIISVLYLFAFATKSLMISGLTDAWGVLFGTMAYYFFLKRSNWIFIILFLSIFQREYVFFIFGLLGLYFVTKDYFIKKEINKFYLGTMFSSIVFFVIYFILRKTIFYTEQHADQLETTGYITNLLTRRFPFWDFIFQSLFIQNILMLYGLTIYYKVRNKMEINKEGIALSLLLLLMVVAVSFIAVLGNSAGRYYHINISVVFYYFALEIYPIFKAYITRQFSLQNPTTTI
jgi:hypothetical protein